MKADPKVIEHLNTQLTNELTAINQYFLHARTLRHWGVTLLGKQEYDESIEEMRHADWLIAHGTYLDPSEFWQFRPDAGAGDRRVAIAFCPRTESGPMNAPDGR